MVSNGRTVAGKERVSQLLLKLLSTMKKRHGYKDLLEEDKPVLPVLASQITYFISGKRIPTSVNLNVVILGMTRSNELIICCTNVEYALVTTIYSLCVPYRRCEMLRLLKPVLVA